MIEALIVLLSGLLLTLITLAVWRALRGPARGRGAAVRRAAVVGLVTVPLVTLAAWNLSNSRDFQFFGGMVNRVETSEPVVALTFDDGPQPEATDEILAILGRAGVRATFFVTGNELAANLPAAQRLVAAGHELGNHSYSHARMIGQPYEWVQSEVERTDALIRAAGYTGPIHFRPPYSKRLLVLPYYLSVTGRTTIFTDVEPESYPEIAAGAETMTAHVLDRVRPGSIILLHVMYPARAETMRAVPAILAGLQAKGYRFVTVTELLALRR